MAVSGFSWSRRATDETSLAASAILATMRRAASPGSSDTIDERSRNSASRRSARTRAVVSFTAQNTPPTVPSATRTGL
jgi:hypothetical protein